jgi:hypothetical protein
VVPVWQLKDGQTRRARFFRAVDTLQRRGRRAKPALIEREVSEAVRAVRAKTRPPPETTIGLSPP